MFYASESSGGTLASIIGEKRKSRPRLRSALLAATPVVFGPLGVIAGAVTVWKGAKSWGAAGLSARFVSAVISAYLAAWLTT